MLHQVHVCSPCLVFAPLVSLRLCGFECVPYWRVRHVGDSCLVMSAFMYTTFAAVVRSVQVSPCAWCSAPTPYMAQRAVTCGHVYCYYCVAAAFQSSDSEDEFVYVVCDAFVRVHLHCLGRAFQL